MISGLMLLWDFFSSLVASFLGLYFSAQSENSLVSYTMVSFLALVAIMSAFSVYSKGFSETFVTRLRGCAYSVVVLFIVESTLFPMIYPQISIKSTALKNIILLVFLIIGRIFFFGACIRFRRSFNKTNPKRTLVIGSGELGCYLVGRTVWEESPEFIPVVFLDDSKEKQGKKILGVPVYGTREKLGEAIKEFSIAQVVIAINQPSSHLLEYVLSVCSDFEIHPKLFCLPSNISQDSSAEKASIADIKVDQLLCRDSISIDMSLAKNILAGKVVMVTGGAGSIGSEICRQVLALGAKTVISYDINENGSFYLGQSLKEYKDRIQTIIGSVRDRKRLEDVVLQYKPQIIFHAAAHKHVPLMEENPAEAIKNNLGGTLKVIETAEKFGAERFVLISTDKAVNPSNIMGATKRGCELLVQNHAKTSKLIFSAVRFGNVLGSNGSVIPTFKAQIAKGGPVTVTHREMTRYFMTIPEAVGLVLEASAISKGGEIFVLDMGEQIPIYDLACHMIHLAGCRPNKDIKIKFTGMRSGEKLCEELYFSKENAKKTSIPKIFVSTSEKLPAVNVIEIVAKAIESAEKGQKKQAVDYLHQLVI